MTWLNPGDNHRQYVEKLKNDSENRDFYRLLQILALALRIEPLLLRNTRLTFFPASERDIELETEVWFSDAMYARNAKNCVMLGGIARVLVDELSEENESLEPYWSFIQEHSKHWPPEERLEQQLRLAARTGDTDALQSGFRQILSTLLHNDSQTKRADLCRWFKGAMPSLITRVDKDEMATLLYHFTAATLGLPAPMTGENELPARTMPDWLKKAIPSSSEIELGIQLYPGVLHCLEANQAQHKMTLKLPLPTPVLLHFDNGYSQWDSLWIGRNIRLQQPFQSIILQTLDGKRYRLSLNDDAPQQQSAPDQAASIVLACRPSDYKQAEQIQAMLQEAGIKVQIIQDELNKSAAHDYTGTLIVRLWSKAASSYWKAHSEPTAMANESAVFLRTQPDLALPEGTNENQPIVVDWQETEANLQELTHTLQDWLTTGQISPSTDTTDLDALLEELENPDTLPRRRLEIGDILAEMGDPRPGVGVREVEIQSLLDELEDISTDPPRRLAIGDQLAERGDPRPGVGVDERGRPDIDWVEIPAGEFIYGEGDSQRTLHLGRFYISRYTITNSQYQSFIDAGGYDDERWWRDLIKPEPMTPSWSQPNRPRESVDWYGAVAFSRWLSEQLGYLISLPSEQQWEKAVRGTDGRQYSWGNEFISGMANIDETRNKEGSWYLEQTTAVGMYPHGNPPYGIADMAGNVWEWCLNKYHQPKITQTDTSHDYRVVRGGSWYYSPWNARCAGRDWDGPDNRDFNSGFRVVCSSPSTDR